MSQEEITSMGINIKDVSVFLLSSAALVCLAMGVFTVMALILGLLL